MGWRSGSPEGGRAPQGGGVGGEPAQGARRVAEQAKKELGDILRTLKDPRIGFVTVTDVEVSNDLSHLKIFVSVYGDQEARQQSLEGLQAAKGLIRSELGRRIRLRMTPEIEFRLDTSLDRRRAHRPAFGGDPLGRAGQGAMSLEAVARVLEAAGPTLIVSHEDPDPDSIGSLLAARWALRRVRPGVPVEAATPEPVPSSCQFLPGADEILSPDEAQARGPWQTLWVLDCEPGRIGRLQPLVAAAQQLVNVDHHASNTQPWGHPRRPGTSTPRRRPPACWSTG